jgi:hypothetical protein
MGPATGGDLVDTRPTCSSCGGECGSPHAKPPLTSLAGQGLRPSRKGWSQTVISSVESGREPHPGILPTGENQLLRPRKARSGDGQGAPRAKGPGGGEKAEEALARSGCLEHLGDRKEPSVKRTELARR